MRTAFDGFDDLVWLLIDLRQGYYRAGLARLFCPAPARHPGHTVTALCGPLHTISRPRGGGTNNSPSPTTAPPTIMPSRGGGHPRHSRTLERSGHPRHSRTLELDHVRTCRTQHLRTSRAPGRISAIIAHRKAAIWCWPCAIRQRAKVRPHQACFFSPR